jgi:hypothetical protein
MPVRTRSARPLPAALLCAASALGCHQVIELPPSQVPRLVTARGAEVDVVDDEGDAVTVRRGEVDEVKLLAAKERRLLTYGGPLTGAGGVNVISVAEEHDAAMQDRGWTRTRPFEGPVDMRVHGELLTVAGHGRVYTVPLQELDVVRLEQPLHGPNWKVVGYVGLGVAIAAPLFTALALGMQDVEMW